MKFLEWLNNGANQTFLIILIFALMVLAVAIGVAVWIPLRVIFCGCL